MNKPTFKKIQLKVNKYIENVFETLEVIGIVDYFQLPETLKQIPNLRHMIIENCAVKIPAWVGDIKTLETLQLENILSASKLLPHIHKLENLKRLKLNCVDSIDNFPDMMEQLQLLEELSINSWNIVDLPEGLSSLKNLKIFDFHLYHNNLERVFDILSKIPQLRKH